MFIAVSVSRICFRDCHFCKHISDMKTWFLRQGYPKNVDESEIKNVWMLHVINNKPQNRTSKRILLVTTYHPLLNSLGKVLSKNLNFLYMNEEVPKLLYPVPIKTDTFTSSVTKKSYKINRKFVSSGKCLTYLLTL